MLLYSDFQLKKEYAIYIQWEQLNQQWHHKIQTFLNSNT